MRVGFLSRFNQERIEFARRNGFRSVELLVGPEADFLPGGEGWQSRAAAVMQAYAEADIRISCLGGFYVNHMDADAVRARAHADHVRRVITLAAWMKVPVVAGFAGRVLHADLEQSLPAFKAIWSEHARAAEEAGVRIAFEHCPMGAYHSPFGGINCMCTPAMWERCFEAVPSPVLGLEWDPSHLLCMGIDPLLNIRLYGERIYHVHAKDARIYRDVTARYGWYHPGAIEHCFPGLGDADWGQIVKELVRAGYRGDLNIEGWHDAVFAERHSPSLEDWGLLIAGRHLSRFVDQS